MPPPTPQQVQALINAAYQEPDEPLPDKPAPRRKPVDYSWLNDDLDDMRLRDYGPGHPDDYGDK